jgi:hypothetical protein
MEKTSRGPRGAVFLISRMAQGGGPVDYAPVKQSIPASLSTPRNTISGVRPKKVPAIWGFCLALGRRLPAH